MLEYGSPVWGGLPQYLMEELERVQRRSLQIIGLPHDYLPTLDERGNKAVARELDVITMDPSHIFYQRIIEHNIYNYDLRRRHRTFKYLYLFQALNFIEPVLSPSNEAGVTLNLVFNIFYLIYSSRFSIFIICKMYKNFWLDCKSIVFLNQRWIK